MVENSRDQSGRHAEAQKEAEDASRCDNFRKQDGVTLHTDRNKHV